MLLDEFEGLGLHCEPRTQLVVLCEVCRRPSTKECWTCGMKICDFCTLKRHWKVGIVQGSDQPSTKWFTQIPGPCPSLIQLRPEHCAQSGGPYVKAIEGIPCRISSKSLIMSPACTLYMKAVK